MARAPITWTWLGRERYGVTLQRQRERRDLVIAGLASEALLLVEHESVVTVGRRPAPGTPTAAWLANHGVDYQAVERGGLATWHGPGQLVAYAIIDASGRKLGVKGLVEALEQGIIDWLRDRGVRASRRQGYHGVWAGRDKICALGLHFRRGVSMHGVALNLHSPPAGSFDLIVPCGITDGGVASLEALAGVAPDPEQSAPSVAASLIAAIEAATRGK